MIINQQASGIKIPGIFEGKVVARDPSMYMGVKIWVPGLHDEKYLDDEEIKNLPTARAAAPLFGNCDGKSGMFAYPEIGTLVYCFCIDGDPNTIVYFAADYEKSMNAATSRPVLKMRYAEKDCAWIKQGPGQIILRTPSKMNPSESDTASGSDSSSNSTRIKVVEIFSGENMESDDEKAASICIFSNNDIEIKGQNISITAAKSININVNEAMESKSASNTNNVLNTMSEEQSSKYDPKTSIKMGTSRISIIGNTISLYSKLHNIVTSIFKIMYFERWYKPLKKPVNVKKAIITDQIESSEN